jgi:hypothetical protein
MRQTKIVRHWLFRFLAVATLHVSLLFASYGLGLFSGSSFWGISAVAFAAYFWTFMNTGWLASTLYREGLWIACSALFTSISLIFGMNLAFYTFGK